MDNSHLLTDILASLLDPNTGIDPEKVAELAREYPYFTLPAVKLLANPDGLTEQQLTRLRMLVALNAPDSDTLFRLTDRQGAEFASFYPDSGENATPTTDSAIDTFLATYGNVDPKEAALLERLIFNPVGDYSQVLAKETAEEGTTPTAADKQDTMMDAFLSRYNPATAQPENSEPEHSPKTTHKQAHPKPKTDSLLSESLARIYVKQRRYDKAFEIIRNLSLNFPEKSAYFADQLRFLQKLILNNSTKD